MGKKTTSKRPFPEKKVINPTSTVAQKSLSKGAWDWFTPIRKQTFFLFLLAFGLYANTLDMGYALDDAMLITGNKFTVKGIHGIKEIMTNDVFVGYLGKNNLLPGGRYRPLTQIMFAIEYQLFGNNPFVGHLINLILYVLLGLLLFHVLRKLMPEQDSKPWYLSIPFIATALFIAHPLHTEAVANIKGRDELLCFGLCLCALYFFIRYADTRKILNLVWTVPLLFLAILAKENALVWIAVVPLTLFFFRKKAGKAIAFSMIPITIAIHSYFITRILALGYFSNDVNNSELLNNPFLGATFVPESARTILYTWGKYFLLLLFPHPLTHDYYPKQIPLIGIGDLRAIVPLLITIGMVVLAFIRLRSKHLLSFAILFFWLTFSMSSNLVVNIGTFMNERFMFAPLLGFTLVIAWLLADRLPVWMKNSETWKRTASVILIIILAGYALKTVTRNREWKNDFVLFTTDVKNSPNSAKCNTSAGGKLVEWSDSTNNPATKQEYLDKAITYLNKAIEIYPTNINTWVLLGNAYIKLKQYPIARDCFKNCLNISPGHAISLNNLLHIAQVTNIEKNFNESVITYKMLITYQRDSARNYFGVGLAYKNAGVFDSSIIWLNKTLSVNPHYCDAYGKLGEIFGQNLNDLERSEQYIRTALECNPKDASALENLGIIYGIRKDYTKSIDFFMQALAINPLNASLNKNIAQTYNSMGNKEKATEFFAKAQQLEAAGKKE